MKLAAIAALVVFLSPQQTPIPQQQPPAKGSIEGIVVRVGTNEPIAGARVTLSRDTLVAVPSAAPPNAPPPGATPVAVAQSGTPPSPVAPIPAVSTDSQGKFVFKEVDAGAYIVQVASNGYARTEYGQRLFGGRGTPVHVSAGQTLKDIAVRMTPAGTVTGRITDPVGRPLVGVPVQLLRPIYNANGQRTVQSGGSTRTNDRGEFRLYWITPGRYYLNAGSQQGVFINVGGGGASPNEVQDSYVSTYYPGVTDISQAMMLEVRPADELSAIDMTVGRQERFRIRGRVIDSRTGQPPQSASFLISSQTPTGGGIASMSGNNQYNASNGTFEFRDLAPGAYTIIASIPNPGTGVTGLPNSQGPRAQAPVTISGGDVENLVLTIVPPMALPGRFSVDGQALSAVPGWDRMRVQLRSADAETLFLSSQSQSQSVTAEGQFTVDNVVVGDYRVSISGVPVGYYLKEARLEQTDVLDQPLHFTGSLSGPLDVVISPNGGQLEATIVNDKQQPAPGIQAVLIPDRQRNRFELYKSAVTDQNGRFTLRGITPGDYKIFAWEAIEQFEYYDPEFLRIFEAKGKPVRISESSKESVEVKIIPSTTP